ncbi:VpaChn25_0724 family phage protein [Leisingera aquaemixtae]|uniref:VpaChn25_0724 family phage protein n=1 Tax=Leisingera aquaemixtae TaxID=1396826 RepID=UPI0040577DE3
MSNQKDQTAQILQRHRSLAILRFLSRSPEYRSNQDVLMDWLRHLAMTCTREELRTLASFLEEGGLLRLENVEGFQVMTLMEKGLEVAEGRDFSEAIKRPGPECPY